MFELSWAPKEPSPLVARSWLGTLTADGDDLVREFNATLDDHAARVPDHLSERDCASVKSSSLILFAFNRAESAIDGARPLAEGFTTVRAAAISDRLESGHTEPRPVRRWLFTTHDE